MWSYLGDCSVLWKFFVWQNMRNMWTLNILCTWEVSNKYVPTGTAVQISQYLWGKSDKANTTTNYRIASDGTFFISAFTTVFDLPEFELGWCRIMSSPWFRRLGWAVKGSVSRVLRWVLLYIDWKLFSRPIITSHKILTLLKGQFTIYKKQAGAPLFSDMVLSRQCWNCRKMGVSAILKFATAPLSDMISRKSTYLLYCRSSSWFYEFILRKWRHSRIPIWQKGTTVFPWYHLTQRSLLRISIFRISIELQKNICQS